MTERVIWDPNGTPTLQNRARPMVEGRGTAVPCSPSCPTQQSPAKRARLLYSVVREATQLAVGAASSQL